MVSGVAVYLSLNKEKSALSLSKGMIEEIANKVSVLLTRKEEPKDKKSDVSTDHSQVHVEKPMNKTKDADSVVNSLALPDTSIIDSTALPEEQVIVRKDELLESRVIEVVELTSDPNIKSKSDSLLEKASGIRNDKRTAGSKIMISVEFWRSPVNYRGYKLGKNKLVLYGLDNSADIDLFKHNNAVYLRHEQSVFKVDAFNDYRAFEKTTDPAILSLLINQ